MDNEKYRQLMDERLRIDQEINSLKSSAENNSVIEYQNLSRKSILEIEKIIVGQGDLLKKLIIAVISGGHVLVEGAPGLAKTLALKSLGQVLNLSFKRIQFTPDLLPSDLVGTRIYNQSLSSFSTEIGPLFANLVLADEINRAPAKVQSALLESMAENQITIGKETHQLPQPFMVVATQNPIENEGTYALPEAQLDRFLFKIIVDYPSANEEKEIVLRISNSWTPNLTKILDRNKIQEMILAARDVHIESSIIDYIVNIVCKTRKPNKYIAYGVSPRASIAIANSAKALAILSGRTFVENEDVNYVLHDCLRHRIVLSYEAIADGVCVDSVISSIENEMTQ